MIGPDVIPAFMWCVSVGMALLLGGSGVGIFLMKDEIPLSGRIVIPVIMFGGAVGWALLPAWALAQ